ncbi:MAG: alpha-D-ribose 1-methylphosphonate 5-triphosphate diphosphatase [Desulfobaccales bacterium]
MRPGDQALVIENGQVVTPEETLKGASLKIESGMIAEIKAGKINSGAPRLDARGGYVLPGFVDLHSDALEKEIEPRPGTFFPNNIAIIELDKKLAACGITTIFHALSFAEGEIGVRSNKMATQIITDIIRLAPQLKINTRVHARYEITDALAVPYLEELLRSGGIQILSFMDHTPGQGQFKEVASFKNYFSAVYEKTDGELDKIIDQKLLARASRHSLIERLATLAKSLNIPLASHDDDCAAKIRWLREMGIGISEFPVNLEALQAAREAGIYVCLGAPNALRGNSRLGNLSAREAIFSGLADIVCSDYTPMAILHVVFTLHHLGNLPLHQSVNLVSLNPARAVGLADRLGSLETGKRADLIVVDASGEVPRIIKTYVAGGEVYSTC